MVAGRVLPVLAGHGRFVIRYDQRDTGQSTTYEPGRPGYTGAEVGVLGRCHGRNRFRSDFNSVAVGLCHLA